MNMLVAKLSYFNSLNSVSVVWGILGFLRGEAEELCAYLVHPEESL